MYLTQIHSLSIVPNSVLFLNFIFEYELMIINNNITVYNHLNFMFYTHIILYATKRLNELMLSKKKKIITIKIKVGYSI